MSLYPVQTVKGSVETFPGAGLVAVDLRGVRTYLNRGQAREVAAALAEAVAELDRASLDRAVRPRSYVPRRARGR